MFTTVTITRKSDNQTCAFPVVMGVAPANVAGQWMYLDVPCLEADIDDAVSDFLDGYYFEQRMQYLYIDGNGTTSDDCDAFTYTLA